MGYYIKKTEQTAPVQAVTESSLKSASEINVPTVKAVLDGLHYPNLLVNGDFQINQRGQSEYNTTSYSMDMWYLNLWNTTGRVTKLDNGIKITNTSSIDGLGFYQYIDKNNSIAKEMTLLIKVDGITYTVSGVPTSSGMTPTVTSEKFDANIRYYEDNNRYRVYVSVKANSYVDIEYIDLFESDIAYPHVKEDYAIALMRCQRKLLVFNNTPIGIGNFYNNIVYATIFIPTSLDSVPTISFNGYRFIIDGWDVANITNVEFGSMSQNLIYVKITLAKSFNSAINGLSGRLTAQGSGNDFMCFSCEPL